MLSFSAQRSRLRARPPPGGATGRGPKTPWQARRTRPGPQPSEAAGAGPRFPRGRPAFPHLGVGSHPRRASAPLNCALSATCRRGRPRRASAQFRKDTRTEHGYAPTQQSRRSPPPSVRAQRRRTRLPISPGGERAPQRLRETGVRSGKWPRPQQRDAETRDPLASE